MNIVISRDARALGATQQIPYRVAYPNDNAFRPTARATQMWTVEPTERREVTKLYTCVKQE